MATWSDEVTDKNLIKTRWMVLCTAQTNCPPGNHHASNFYKCPISRSKTPGHRPNAMTSMVVTWWILFFFFFFFFFFLHSCGTIVSCQISIYLVVIDVKRMAPVCLFHISHYCLQKKGYHLVTNNLLKFDPLWRYRPGYFMQILWAYLTHIMQLFCHISIDAAGKVENNA